MPSATAGMGMKATQPLRWIRTEIPIEVMVDGAVADSYAIRARSTDEAVEKVTSHVRLLIGAGVWRGLSVAVRVRGHGRGKKIAR